MAAAFSVPNLYPESRSLTMMNEDESAAGEDREAVENSKGPWQDWVVSSDSQTARPPMANPPVVVGDEHQDAVGRWRQQSIKRNRKSKRPFWIELPILVVVAFALTFMIQTFVAKVYYVPSGSMEKTLHGVPSGGDRILASKIVYDFRDPKQGDIVVFKGPDTWAPEVADVAGPTNWLGKAISSLGSVVGIAPPNEKDFVKRVIAVGGQTVACCDVKGNVTVDGKSLVEPYVYQPNAFDPGVADCKVGGPDEDHYASLRCFAPFKVPDGQLFVMGDHRGESSDSSYECWGLKPALAAAYQQQDGSGCWRPIPVSDVIGKAIFIVMPPSRWGTLGNPDIDPQALAIGPGATAAVPVAGGLLLTLGLRGSLAMVPSRRRRRKHRKAARQR
jgi:signal peptidase I